VGVRGRVWGCRRFCWRDQKKAGRSMLQCVELINPRGSPGPAWATCRRRHSHVPSKSQRHPGHSGFPLSRGHFGPGAMSCIDSLSPPAAGSAHVVCMCLCVYVCMYVLCRCSCWLAVPQCRIAAYCRCGCRSPALQATGYCVCHRCWVCVQEQPQPACLHKSPPRRRSSPPVYCTLLLLSLLPALEAI
jgi:hypothetical protein